MRHLNISRKYRCVTLMMALSIFCFQRASAQDNLTRKAVLGPAVQTLDMGTMSMPMDRAAALDDGRVLFAYQDASNPEAGQVRIISVGEDNSLQLGAPVVFANTLNGKDGSDFHADMLVLSPERFVVAWMQTGTPWCMGVLGTIQGDTITVGEPLQLSPHKGEFPALAKLSDSSFALVNNDATRERGTARVVEIGAGDIMKAGMVFDFSLSDAQGAGYAWNAVAAGFGPEKFAFAWRNHKRKEGVTAQLATLNGESLTFSTPLNLPEGKTYPLLEPVDGETVLLATLNVSQGQSLSVHALRPEGTELNIGSSGMLSNTAVDYPALAHLEGGNFIAVFRNRTQKSSAALVPARIAADGTSIEVGAKQTIMQEHTVPRELVALHAKRAVLFYWNPGSTVFKAAVLRLE